MRNKKTFWIFSILSILMFWVSWATIYFSFYGEGSHKWLFPIVAFSFASILFYLLIVITKRPQKLYVLSIFVTMPAIVLGGEYWHGMIMIWSVGYLFYLIAIKRIKVEQYNRVKINIYRILQRGIPIIGTTLSLLIAGGFYFSIISRQRIGDIPKMDIRLSKKTTNGALKAINFIVPTDELYWVLDGMTISEYIDHTIDSQVELGREDMEMLSVPEKRVIDQSQLENQENIFEASLQMMQKQLGIKISADNRMDEVINRFANKRINEIVNGELVSIGIVPIGIAFGMFVTIRSLIWILNSALYWIVSGVFFLLVRAKIFIIKKQTKQVEEIE